MASSAPVYGGPETRTGGGQDDTTDPLTSTPEEFADYVKKEISKWGEVVRRAGLKAD
jgi:tripartite-type tricarboxylate transporter receptor subunit TctC